MHTIGIFAALHPGDDSLATLSLTGSHPSMLLASDSLIRRGILDSNSPHLPVFHVPGQEAMLSWSAGLLHVR